MNVTARVDYALRALLALAVAEPSALTAQALADRHDLPLTFLQSILGELRRARLVHNQRLPMPGYRLTRAAESISVGEIIRALDGDPTTGRDHDLPDDAGEVVRSLHQLWKAADTALLGVIDTVTLADLRDGRLPA
ncbi:Rrf2 family transcriptional regulator [Actinocorallia longicatena]|uniref:BadM/Rrf2 family transcriptional regulator n=1 Tax=Actinocorallia longicatena TaxID=111803 RepID=A0ABP6Q2F5_9ACTN